MNDQHEEEAAMYVSTLGARIHSAESNQAVVIDEYTNITFGVGYVVRYFIFGSGTPLCPFYIILVSLL